MTSTETPKLTEITTKLVELLTPLETADRHRVINATYMLLGETPIEAPTRKEKEADTDDGGGGAGGNSDSNRSPVVRSWMKQNEISEDQLSQVFHIDGGAVEIIAADVPGSKNAQKTPKAYLLAALAKFLVDGTGKVDDKTARALCTKLGCMDATNHAAILKNNLGNHFTGDKSKGWTLTGPGKKSAAELVKEMTK
ncbi:MAG: hypothetical protein K2P94_14820 [Rhodospirillaceae bacterium]|nr:hypothetical protein [Rhodospirillaceae bacterium]